MLLVVKLKDLNNKDYWFIQDTNSWNKPVKELEDCWLLGEEVDPTDVLKPFFGGTSVPVLPSKMPEIGKIIEESKSMSKKPKKTFTKEEWKEIWLQLNKGKFQELEKEYGNKEKES